jgi:hypothetical protein
MSTPDLPADVVEAKKRINEGEGPQTSQDNTTTHTAGEVQDPAEDYHAPEFAEDPHHDDVDVALQDGKDTQDGKGDEEVPPADFQSYADSSADDGQEQN